mgnify:CR=1 FL=1
MKTTATELIAPRISELIGEITGLHITGGESLALACKHATDFAQSAAKVGNKLLECKALLKQGQFEDFVEGRLHMPMRTAQRYMSMYRKSLIQVDIQPQDHLQLAFSAIDYKPAVKKNTPLAARTSGLLGQSSAFWQWSDKHPVDEWDDIDKAEFAADTARRLEMCKENQINLPE